MLVHPLLRRFVVMSGGHCTYPTGGPAIRLKNKKTDEAQDVYLTLFRQVVWNVLIRCTISFADMAFGRSVVLHFPQEIHKNLGISEVAPQLLRALDA